MSNDEKSQTASTNTDTRQDAPTRSFFSLPPAVKRVFDKFPLVTYDANELPIQSPRYRQEHVLYVFGDEEGNPSYNPRCLRWQTYLKFSGIRFSTQTSNNHASPSGVLPYLAVGGKDGQEVLKAGKEMQKWVGKKEGVDDVRYEAYMALIEERVRKAWLYQLYLTPQNSELVHRLYVAPCSSMPLVQMAIARHLRSAAEVELIRSAGTNVVSALDLIRDAEEAFQALSTLLGEDEWFFGQTKPGLFDASVFAYTHLILDHELGWKLNELKDALAKHENLVRHEERVKEVYF